MINISTKIHDKFSIEFKVGFSGSEHCDESNFTVNAWIFVPNSFGINAATYGKDLFYRDVKSNVRLITPDFSMAMIADSSAAPLSNLAAACSHVKSIPDFEFQVKMFAAIYRSALREAMTQSSQCKSSLEAETFACDTISHIREILSRYRDIGDTLFCNSETDASKAATIFQYADEYMSHITYVQAVKIVKQQTQRFGSEADKANVLWTDLIRQEDQYKAQLGYSRIQPGNELANRDVVTRNNLLKKYIESALFLKVETAPDGKAMQQISFGIAAGIAMLLYTLIALPFQRYLGNYPNLILVVLIVAYIFKDRVKEWVRNRFAYRLKSKYFDSKTTFQFKGQQVGWIKEGMDYISDEKTPTAVMNLRNRSGFEADNALFQEKILLYRKQVHVDNRTLRHEYEYSFSGFNDILRLYMNHFTQKMDDPEISTDTIDENGRLVPLTTTRAYTMHIVLQFSNENDYELHAFEVTLCRDGILGVVEL